MSEHERIWLEPAPGADEEYGRQWCQDNVWDDGVEYVLADTVSSLTAERDRLREALSKAEPYVEICHSLMTGTEPRKSVWLVLKQIRAALSPVEESK